MTPDMPFQLLGLLIAFVVVGLLMSVAAQKFAPKFEARSLLNKSEQRLFANLRADCPKEWIVFAQVSYGEILGCTAYKKYMTINAKRADFVICNERFRPVAVVEYQGAGHRGNSAKSRQRAEQSDRQKRRALAEAGVPLIEVSARYESIWIKERLADLGGRTDEEGLSSKAET